MGWIHSFAMGSERARWIWQTVNALCIEYQVTSTLIPTTLPRILCFNLHVPWPLFLVLMCDLWTLLLYSLNEGHGRGPQFWGNYSDDERITPSNQLLSYLSSFVYLLIVLPTAYSLVLLWKFNSNFHYHIRSSCSICLISLLVILIIINYTYIFYMSWYSIFSYLKVYSNHLTCSKPIVPEWMMIEFYEPFSR